MTVKELIEALQTYDPTCLMILSRDPEGNGYSPVADLGLGVYDDDGEYYQDLKEYDEYGTKRKEPQSCVAIWPR